MHNLVQELKGDARRSLKSCEFETAGQKFTSAAHLVFAVNRLDCLDSVSPGLVLLLRASLSYRLDDSERRSAYRARNGALIIEEVEELVVETDVERGILAEYKGDFELISGRSDGADSYQRALGHYSNYEENTGVDERIGQMSEPPFRDNTDLLRELIEATETSIDEDTTTKIEYRSPVERIRFKRNRFPEIVESVIERQRWLRDSAAD